MKRSARRWMVGVLAIIALFVFGSPAFAQGAGVGVKIGPTFNSLSGLEEGDTVEGKTGWQAGIFFGGNRRGTIGVMGEFNYARKNFEEPGGGKIKLSYIQVPVFLRVNAGSRSTEGVAGYFIVGPFVNLKLKAEADDDEGDEFDDQIEGADVGVIVGGGVEITRFIIEVRGDFGMRKINKADDVTDTSKIKTRSFAILFGLRFN